jgi:hypothetical protein
LDGSACDKLYGKMFIRNDIIGYGFDLKNRSIFYTKIGDFFAVFVMKCLQVCTCMIQVNTCYSQHPLFWVYATMVMLWNNFGQRPVFFCRELGKKDEQINNQ